MLYTPKLQVPQNINPITISVCDVFYTVQEDGKIEISLVTQDYEYETIDYLYKSKYPKVSYCNVEEICPQDTFLVYIEFAGNIRYEYWKLINRVDTPPYSIRINKEPECCPSCKQLLSKDELGVYCINLQCPAKIKLSIRRYLLICTNESWLPYELSIIDKLIDCGVVKNVASLYTLTSDIIDNFLYYENVNSEVSDSIITKIDKTKGAVTPYRFLQSLSIPHYDGWYISKQKFDSEFRSMESFIDWIQSVDESKITEYMTTSTYSAILEYFSIETNQELIIYLLKNNIFT